MNPADPKETAVLDLRQVWRASYAGCGPAWTAAIEMGIDVNQLEHNLSLSATERLIQHEEMMRTFEQLHGAALSEQR